jgi:predicted nucleic acid-binding protein
MIIVDSNVLIDVFEEIEQEWRGWSIDRLVLLSGEDRIVVNQVAFAEVAPRMGSIESFQEQLSAFEIEFEPICQRGAFEAGRAFLAYRKRRAAAKLVLPDFFIGGHACVTGAAVLTRDPRFYRSYFPSVPLITPDRA